MKKIIFVFSIFSLLSSLPAQAMVCGKISSMRGEMEVLRVKRGEQGKENPVRTALRGKENMSLDCTDIIVTQEKSRAKVQFSNQAVMTLGPHTRIAVARYAKDKGDPSLLKLTYGKIRVLFDQKHEEGGKGDSQKSNKKINLPKTLPSKKYAPEATSSSRFEVKTATAVVGVRGTDFYVSFNPNVRVTEQATIEGSVMVEQSQTGEKVLVNKGQQVAVEAPVAAEKAPAKEGEPDQEPVAQVKPLKVVPIAPQVAEEIRQTSAIAKVDKEFTHKAAVEILGPPEKWHPPKDELPFDLKELKEEF